MISRKLITRTLVTRKLATTTALLLLHSIVWADSSYQSSSQMTGGTLVNMMKSTPFAPASVKTMLEPTITITAVHGNQKVVTSKERTEIYDIDKETVTRIDNTKKTYTVITFDQMRQMMKDMPQKLAEMQAKLKQAPAQNQAAPQFTITFDTKVNDPGVSKAVNGLQAQERVITVTTKVTQTGAAASAPPSAPANAAPKAPPDAASNGQPISITYVTTTDLWFAPEPPEMQEIEDFDVRMYTKISEGMDVKAMMEQLKAMANSAGMGMMLNNQPGASSAMEEMNKEIAKIKGIRVLEVTTMSGMGLPTAPAGANGSAATPPPSGDAVAGQAAGDSASQTASGQSSKIGIFGGALAGSALGAFHHKKSTPAAAPATDPAGAAGSGTASDPNALMVTTAQKTNFSRDTVPASAFQIPAGYKQVEVPSGMF
jgi:hypothetical protein